MTTDTHLMFMYTSNFGESDTPKQCLLGKECTIVMRARHHHGYRAGDGEHTVRIESSTHIQWHG